MRRRGPAARGAGGWGSRLLVVGFTAAVFVASVANGRASEQPLGPSRTVAGETVAAHVHSSVDRLETTVVDQVVLTVEVEAEAGVAVGGLAPSPVVGQRLGGFTVAAVRRAPPVLAGDGSGLLHRWTIVLDPYLPGDAEIPAFQAIGAAAEGQTAAALGAASDSLTVNVRSVVTEGVAFDPGALRGPLDPAMAPPRNGIGWGVAAAGGVACVILGAVGAMAIRPTPARRVRQAFARLEQRARRTAEVSDPAERASLVVSVVREGLAMTIGPRARSATGDEIGSLLRMVEGVPVDEAARVAALGTWLDLREFGGVSGQAPVWPDVPKVLRPLRDAAERATEVSASGASRRDAGLPASGAGAPLASIGDPVRPMEGSAA